MEKMKNMKKNQMKVLAVVCAILALVGVGTAVYAGFSTTVVSTGHKGIISSWQVGFGEESFTDGEAVAGKTLAINADTQIAPGDSGDFVIKLVNGSDVGADVYIDLYNVRVGIGEGVYTALDQTKNNIIFCKDEGCTDIITVNETGANAVLTSADLIGSVNAKGTYTAKVYWKWISSTQTEVVDGATVNFDNAIAGKTIKLDFSATMKQKNPGA